jgi:hypothetical protein
MFTEGVERSEVLKLAALAAKWREPAKVGWCRLTLSNPR